MALKESLTYANVIATVALFISLGGGAYAALSITGKDIVNGSITGNDIKTGSLTGANIKGGSVKSEDVSGLKPKDFVGGVVPAPTAAPLSAPPGPQGAKGEQGEQGIPGPIDGTGAGGALAGTFPNPTIKSGAVGPEALAPLPGARANGSEVSIGPQADSTIDLGGEAYDTGGMYTPGDDFVSVTRDGTYLVNGYITWNGGAGTERQVRFLLNDQAANATFYQVDETNSADLFRQEATTTARLAVGDKVYLGAFVDTGVAVGTTYFGDGRVSLALQWLGP